MQAFIIVTGDTVAGFEYVGPFVNEAEAVEYAEQFIGSEWSIAPIDSPAMETRSSVERKTASGEWR